MAINEKNVKLQIVLIWLKNKIITKILQKIKINFKW